MAVTYTVTNVEYTGALKKVSGTFTSATGDGNGETITASTHGLNFIADHGVSLSTGGLNPTEPKTAVSSGTLTWTVDDTLGYSGRWMVHGR